MDPDIEHKIYAGVLGKILGVYLGRPVEGWSYERIMETFGEVGYFVNDALGLPIVLPDDDISGTFTFFRALPDNGHPRDLTPQMVGRTWLNYIVEEKTILWWGGLGRSTEHTAFLRLKHGVEAPASGSHALNGSWLPAQIGAQIFMDAFAMAAPGDPDLAAHLVRTAASVSHDGIALDAAVLLGTMEAMAFETRDVDTLLDAGLGYVRDDHLQRVIGELRDQCARTDDWHRVRHWIAGHHGYDHYEGPCHMVPNHAVVLMALIMGGDDFSRALTIATTAGWDTDCNAGNVGCLNGIRLGLEALDSGPDLRGPVADAMYVVSADGAGGITDAVVETRRIVTAAAALTGAPAPGPRPRFGFDYPGAAQGFAPCPGHAGRQAVTGLGGGGERGLTLALRGLSPGVTGSVSTPVFVAPYAASSSFAMLASPTLYPGQTVTAILDGAPGIRARLYALYYDFDDEIRRLDGPWTPADGAGSRLDWQVPQTNGAPLWRLGVELGAAARHDGEVALRSLDWGGAPSRYAIEGMLVKSIWNLSPFWVRAFVSSARHLAPDFKWTLCVSHPEDNGVVTTGSTDWDDYRLQSVLDYAINDGGGLVVRARGHRRYYAGILKGDEALLLRRFDDEVTVLDRAAVSGRAEGRRALAMTAKGDELTLAVDGETVCRARDDAFGSGAAGFVVARGTIVADGFEVTAMGDRRA